MDIIKSEINKYFDEQAGKVPVTSCTGYIQNVYKLPCRHSFSVDNCNKPISISLIGKRWFTNVTEVQETFNLSDDLEFERCLTNVMYKTEALIKNAETYSDRRRILQALESFNQKIINNTEPSIENGLFPDRRGKFKSLSTFKNI